MGWLTVLFAVTVLVLITALTSERLARRSDRESTRYWRDQYLGHTVDLSLFAFECSDLIPEWEATRPAVKSMAPRQRYSAWLTLCANAIDREHLEYQIKNGE